MASIVQLDHLRLITVTGPDRDQFLQGQLTQDIARLGPATTSLGGWADARGRLLWAGHLFRRADSICLVAAAAAANALAARLKLFVLRSRVQIACPELHLNGCLDARGADRTAPSDCDPQVIALAADPTRELIVAGPGSASPGPASAPGGATDEWRLRDIRTGIPEIVPATSGEFVPQMVNLDLLDGISFSKGCYTGQEIVARTRFLGRVKRRMLRFAVMGTPPPHGATVHAGHGSIGQVVNAVQTATHTSELLAVIRLEAATGACSLDADGSRPLTRLALPYDIPELAGG